MFAHRADVDSEVALHRLQHRGCERCGTPSSPAKFLLDGSPASVACLGCFHVDEINELIAWLAEDDLVPALEFALTSARLHHSGAHIINFAHALLADVPHGAVIQ